MDDYKTIYPITIVVEATEYMTEEARVFAKASLEKIICKLKESQNVDTEINISIMCLASQITWLKKNVTIDEIKEVELEFSEGKPNYNAMLDGIESNYSLLKKESKKCEKCRLSIIYLLSSVKDIDGEEISKKTNELRQKNWYKYSRKYVFTTLRNIELIKFIELAEDVETILTSDDIGLLPLFVQNTPVALDEEGYETEIKQNNGEEWWFSDWDTNERDPVLPIVEPCAKKLISEIVLPFETICINEVKTNVVRCQVERCSKEEALTEVFVVKQEGDKLTLKNISMEKAEIELKLTKSRKIMLRTGEVIECIGVGTIKKCKQGIQLEPAYFDAIVRKVLGVGEIIEVTDGDCVVYNGEKIFAIKQYENWNPVTLKLEEKDTSKSDIFADDGWN